MDSLLLRLLASAALNALGGGHDAYPARQVQGLYLVAAQLNHSCRPNAVFYLDPNAPGGDAAAGASALTRAPLIVRTVTDVAAGEELTLAYTELLQPRAARKDWLQQHYLFDCACVRCETENTASGDPLAQHAAGATPGAVAEAESAFAALPWDATASALQGWLEGEGAALGETHAARHEARLLLAQRHQAAGKWAAAASLYEAVLAHARTIYPAHWPTLPTLHRRLHTCYQQLGSERQSATASERKSAIASERQIGAAADQHRRAFELERAVVRGPRCAACRRFLLVARACARCQRVHYCGADCQRQHWAAHKAACAQ